MMPIISAGNDINLEEYEAILNRISLKNGLKPTRLLSIAEEPRINIKTS